MSALLCMHAALLELCCSTSIAKVFPEPWDSCSAEVNGTDASQVYVNTDYQAPVTKAEMQSAPQRRSQLSELPGPHHTATDRRKPAALMLRPKPFWMHLTLGFCSSPLRFLVTTGPCAAAQDLTFKGTVEIQHRSIPLPACLLSVLKPQRDTAPKGGWGVGCRQAGLGEKREHMTL